MLADRIRVVESKVDTVHYALLTNSAEEIYGLDISIGFEDFVTERVHEGQTIAGLYPATTDETRADFATWREKNGR